MIKKVVIGFGLTLVVILAQAQYTSRLGRFQVDEIKGCAPFTLTLTNLVAGECTASKPCAMDYEGNGTTQQNQFTFTYTTAGTYTLSVIYQNVGADDIVITVDENIVPDFEIYSCAGSGVQIKVLEKSYHQLVIDFTNDGVPETIIPSGNNAVASHTYATPGNKVISVRGRDLNSADNCATNSQDFTAIPTLPAATITQLTTLDATSLQLDFNTQPHIQYRLEIAVNNAATFQLYQQLYEPTGITIPNLNTEENYYCFRLSSFNPCNGTNTYSNIICSQNFDLTLASGVNQLQWATSLTGIQRIDIERDDAAYTSIPGAPLSFNDTNVECTVTYCYRVISQYAGGVTSTSLQKCGETFFTDTPPAISNTSAVVNPQGQGVALEWLQDPASDPSSYRVLRSQDQKNFSQLGSVEEQSFTDEGYNLEGGFSYQINYEDDCGNASPAGSVITPIRLFGEMNNLNIASIRWNTFKGWGAGVSHYVVDKYNQQGNVYASVNMGQDTVFVDDEPDPDNQVVTYRIRAVPLQPGISPSLSNVLTFTKGSNIFSPTAFSPNGDNLNDVFRVSGQFIVDIELSIFNRWGEMIYNSQKNEPWDGTINGKPVDEDAYIWSVQVTDLAGRTFKESGTVAVLRNRK